MTLYLLAKRTYPTSIQGYSVFQDDLITLNQDKFDFFKIKIKILGYIVDFNELKP